MSDTPFTDHQAFAQIQAQALHLPIEQAVNPAVVAHLETAFRLASLFLDFGLEDDAEPAPVFDAGARS